MAWGDTSQREEIEGLLDRLRAARHSAQDLLQQAEEHVVAALSAELTWTDTVDKHRQEVRDLSVEIDTLLDELRTLIPPQRTP